MFGYFFFISKNNGCSTLQGALHEAKKFINIILPFKSLFEITSEASNKLIMFNSGKFLYNSALGGLLGSFPCNKKTRQKMEISITKIKGTNKNILFIF
jgi:hypothetical protein